MEKPRTWTLEGTWHHDWPGIAVGERVKVIEAGPVLDLLERMSAMIGEALESRDLHGIDLLPLLTRANELANERDALLLARNQGTKT